MWDSVRRSFLWGSAKRLFLGRGFGRRRESEGEREGEKEEERETEKTRERSDQAQTLVAGEGEACSLPEVGGGSVGFSPPQKYKLIAFGATKLTTQMLYYH